MREGFGLEAGVAFSKPPGVVSRGADRVRLGGGLEDGVAPPMAGDRWGSPPSLGIRQTLEGSFSAVSKPNFTRKYALESSRRDLHNALLCTALKSHFFSKMLLEFC